MKKWIKATLIVTPLLLGTSVYAFATDRTANQAAIDIQEIQPAANVTASSQTTSQPSDIPNPFVVDQAQIQQELANQPQTQQSAAQQGAPLTIEQISKLNLQAKTDHGNLKIEYHVEGNGTPRLNGEIGSLKVHLSGDKAKEMLNQLLTRWNLFSTLQQVLNNPNMTVNSKVVAALNELELETKQGKKLELDGDKLKGELDHLIKAPLQFQTGSSAPKIVEPTKEEPKAKQWKEKQEDNGKHKGHEKFEGKNKQHEEDEGDEE